MATKPHNHRLPIDRIPPPSGWLLPIYFCVITLAISIGLLVAGEFSELALRQVLRFSARVAMCAFLLAFSASSLHLLWPTTITHWLRQQRRYLGVSFAATFLLHGIAIGLRVIFFPKGFVETLNPMVINVGGAAFVIALLMAVTSSNSVQRRLGPAWKGLHWFGNYFILLQFVAGEILRLQKDPVKYAPYGVLLALVILLRIIARLTLTMRKLRNRYAATIGS